jgi:hypothetical protein
VNRKGDSWDLSMMISSCLHFYEWPMMRARKLR